MFTNDELHMIKYALEHLHDTDLSNFKKKGFGSVGVCNGKTKYRIYFLHRFLLYARWE